MEPEAIISRLRMLAALYEAGESIRHDLKFIGPPTTQESTQGVQDATRVSQH